MWFYLAGANAPAFLVFLSLEINMQTSALVILQDYVPDSPKTHRPMFDNHPRDIVRVVVSKQVTPASGALSVDMSFVLEARPTRKNGRPEEITLPMQLSTGHEKIDNEDEFGKQLYAYTCGYFDFVLTWMRAYKSKLINAIYNGDDWATALAKATLRSVDDDELRSWSRDQQSAVLFVDRMIADTQLHMQKIGLEVSIGS
jgi:hypothetical protein